MDDLEHVRATLRLPAPLHQQLEASARSNTRSLNAEIVERLTKSFEVDAGLVLDQARQIWSLRNLIARLHIELAYARSELKEHDLLGAEHAASLTKILTESTPHTQYFIDLSYDDWRAARERMKLPIGDPPPTLLGSPAAKKAKAK